MAKSARIVVGLSLLLGACGGTTPPPATQDKEPLPALEEGAAKDSPEVQKGKNAIEAKDFAGARAIFEGIVAKTPKDAIALHYLGVALEGLNDLEGAAAKYRAALEAKPDLTDSAVNLSALLISAQRYAEAIALLQPLVAKIPRDPLLHLNLAFALTQTKDFEGAIKEYKAALASGPEPTAQIGLADALVSAGKNAEATDLLKKMLAGNPESVEVLATIADLFRNLDAYADCVAAYDKAIEKKPAAQLYTERGVCRRGVKDHAGAKADYLKATELDPRYGPAWYLLGQHLWAIEHKKPEALKAFDECAKVAPQSKCKQAADALRAGKN